MLKSNEWPFRFIAEIICLSLRRFHAYGITDKRKWQAARFVTKRPACRAVSAYIDRMASIRVTLFPVVLRKIHF